jgi:hypothetical protein
MVGKVPRAMLAMLMMRARRRPRLGREDLGGMVLPDAVKYKATVRNLDKQEEPGSGLHSRTSHVGADWREPGVLNLYFRPPKVGFS